MTNNKMTHHLLMAILRSINTTNQILADANAEKLADFKIVQEMLNADQTTQNILMEILDNE